MTVLGFLLPPDSGEKLTLRKINFSLINYSSYYIFSFVEITILLSIVMFSLLISGIIPASSTALPTIVMYFATVMCMCSMSVVATVFVLVLHHRNAKNYTMPMWVRSLKFQIRFILLKMRFFCSRLKSMLINISHGFYV